MKKLLFVLFIAAIPFSVSAALDKFPVTPEEILGHHLEHTDWLLLVVEVWESGKANPIVSSPPYWINKHPKEDGSWESISTLSRRSGEELEGYIQQQLREIVRRHLDLADPTLGGKRIKAEYGLWQDIHKISSIPKAFVIIGVNETLLTFGSDGKVAIPEEVFEINLLEKTMARSRIPILIDGILSAELTTEDENGNVTGKYRSADWDWIYFSSHPAVDTETDTLSIPTQYFTDPVFKQGKVTVSFRGGVEKTFDRSSGKLFEMVLPDLRPISISPLYAGSVLLTVSGVKEDQQLVIDQATDLPRWEEMPSSALAKAGKTSTGDITLFVDKKGERGFFQARVVPSSIRIR